MTDRTERILALAGSLYDLPGWFTNPVMSKVGHGTRGLAASKSVPCPSCTTGRSPQPGYRVDKFGRREPCVTCGGVLGGKKGKGTVKVDQYDNTREVLRTMDSTPTRHETVRCDACNGQGAHGNGQRCERCNGTGQRAKTAFVMSVDDPEHVEMDRYDAYIDALAKRNASGDYEALERAIVDLVKHANKPAPFELLREPVVARAAQHLFVAAYVTTDSIVERRANGRLLKLALAYVDYRMPDPVRVPRQVLDAFRRGERRIVGKHLTVEARAVRDEQMLADWEAGKPTAKIAAERGLSVRAVQEGCDRARRVAA